MIPDTLPCILPYTYHHIARNLVQIIHPEGVRITRTKSQIENILKDAYPDRPLSSHERMMYENAMKVFDEHI